MSVRIVVAPGPDPAPRTVLVGELLEGAASGAVEWTTPTDPRRPGPAATVLRALLLAGHRPVLDDGRGRAVELAPDLLADRPLLGVGVIVTRAASAGPSLTDGLTGLGADAVALPVIAEADPDDGGAALRAAVGRLDLVDWIVVTSPTGAGRLLAAVGPDGLPAGVRVATVGPGTAAVLRDQGIEPALVPARSVGEGLVAEFPTPGGPGRRVLLARAAVARDVVPEGLRALGWDVDDVVAYRTVHPPVAPAVLTDAVARADVVTCTSSSTVTGFLAAWGGRAVPPVVACLGPVAARTALDEGLAVDLVADPHTVPGLLAALVGALAPGARLAARLAARG